MATRQTHLFFFYVFQDPSLPAFLPLPLSQDFPASALLMFGTGQFFAVGWGVLSWALIVGCLFSSVPSFCPPDATSTFSPNRDNQKCP